MTVNTYYFNGSVSGPADPGGVWFNDANIIDGNIATFTGTTTIGSATSNYLEVKGTNAPSINEIITQVRARFWHDDASMSLWSAYENLINPTTGWTPTAVSTLEMRIWKASSNSSLVGIYEAGSAGVNPLVLLDGFNIAGDIDAAIVEVEVTSVLTGKLTNVAEMSNIQTLTF